MMLGMRKRMPKLKQSKKTGNHKMMLGMRKRMTKLKQSKKTKMIFYPRKFTFKDQLYYNPLILLFTPLLLLNKNRQSEIILYLDMLIKF